MTIHEIKSRFGIIGNSPLLERAIDIARQVAATDLSVLITGESGSGKEVFPQIIHQLSSRKHGPYIAVNCGAIPEGTIDSELFGHEKGSFTGAHESRKGYFEVANGGTIFLDEVAELPLSTQVRLLRVLETGEYIRVGSSKMQKTEVRIVAATNLNVQAAINRGRFREDLYYRLNTVPIHVPSLRERRDDIHLLFRKFASDLAEKYRMPPLSLQPEALTILLDYRWPGNIRQLKNVTEQLSILEPTKEITAETLMKYLPQQSFSNVPALMHEPRGHEMNEREILYKVLFDMKHDLNDLKKIVAEILQNAGDGINLKETRERLADKLYKDLLPSSQENETDIMLHPVESSANKFQAKPTDVAHTDHSEVVEESLSLADQEKELIKRAIEKHRGKRKYAARELGISERTLYRKLLEYNLK